MSFANHGLGKRPAIEKRALMLADVLTGVVPAIPVEMNNLDGVPHWEMGANDRYGTCGPTSIANFRRLVTHNVSGNMDAVTLEDVFDLYRRSGNPDFPHEDNGVYMHVMMDELARNGIGGRKPLAFAKIAPGDMDTLDKAIAIFGGAILGVWLQVAQQRQSVWDFTVGSGDWGGHAVVAGRYTDPEGEGSDRIGIITWAEEVPTTRQFITQLEDEAWVVIWPEHLQDSTFLQGVNVEALKSAYEDLTGRSFPDFVPPEPAPPLPPSADELLEPVVERALRTKLPKYQREAFQLWLDSRD